MREIEADVNGLMEEEANEPLDSPETMRKVGTNYRFAAVPSLDFSISS